MAYLENLRKLFPNTSTVAYYSPFGQHIVLNSINIAEFEKAMDDTYNLSNLETIKIITHELKHWKDHHTTIWGINSLVDIYNAINSRLLNNPEQFHYIVTFIRNAKKSDLTEYYHTKLKQYDVKKNGLYWKWRLSVGARFDVNGNIDHNLPVPFVRFLNPSTDELLSRTPLSESSFLETNAIFEEMKFSREAFQKLDDQSLIVQSKIMEAENIKWLYNCDLTLYSVSAHLISSILEKKDIPTSFSISSQISNLLLNLPQSLYKNIPINPYLSEFKERNELLKSQKDTGFAFLNLVLNYSDKHKGTEVFNIEDFLFASNLPNKEIIEHIILDEFKIFKHKVIDGPFSQKVLNKIENAIKYFKQNGLDGATFPVTDFLNFEKPTVIFGDTMIDDSAYDYEKFKENILNGIQLTDPGWILMQEDLFQELETFYNICGV